MDYSKKIARLQRELESVKYLRSSAENSVQRMTARIRELEDQLMALDVDVELDSKASEINADHSRSQAQPEGVSLG